MALRLRLMAIGLAALLMAGGASSALAQGITGQISGIVADTQQGVLPGATVTVRNSGTNATRETVTSADGSFVFPDLLAGTYDLTASLGGFKSYEQRGIVVGATERVTVRGVVLEVGNLSEQITVQGGISLVQTQTAARSAQIDRQQLDNIALKGRDFAGMLQLLPGVIDTRNREAPGNGSLGGLSINGRGSFNFTTDGVTQKDTGANGGNYAAPAMDSIAEIKVQASNFQAEYGRSSGATISVITRSGTSTFHGSAAYYKRDDAFNGNEYLRRQRNLDKVPYKFDNAAWTLGGPVTPARNKLFFFFSQELLSRTEPGAINQRRMPSELERRGDFSQTLDSAGRLIFIRDPLLTGACNSVTGGPACFSGNQIPANRLNAAGLGLLGLFPMPNATDPTGARLYNYSYQPNPDHPRNDQILRVDWNVAPNTTFYARGQWGSEKTVGCCPLGANGGWPEMLTRYQIDTKGIVNTLLHTFNNTTFLETTVGLNWAHQHVHPVDDSQLAANDRSKTLAGLPQFYPQANPLNLVPNMTMTGGVPGTVGQVGFETRFPFFGYNRLWNTSANLTKVVSSHNLKTGLFIEHTSRPAARASSFNGSFSFNTDGSNPCNTNIGMANVLLGCITQYTESTTHPEAHGSFMNVEWYVQDNWRVKRNFTIDAGVRFYEILPTRSIGDKVAMFEPSSFNNASAAQLVQPAVVNGARVGRNPITGETLPAVYIGRIAAGAGDPFNGTKVFDETVMKTPPVKIAPRIGFAWDVTGDGRTAIRGGAGVFYDRFADDIILSLVEMPPLLDTRTTNYTTIPNLLASPLTISPRTIDAVPEFVPPVVYNWSIGVQRDLGKGLAADAAYVGNAARDQYSTGGAPTYNLPMNGRGYGYRFLPGSLDPTNVVAGQAQPYADDFLRPYQGLSSITGRLFTGYGNYHGLQFALNKRGAGLSYGASYTYQLVNKNLIAVDPFLEAVGRSNDDRNYTQNGRRPHSLVVNYSYNVPDLGKKVGSGVLSGILGNWQVTGITSFLSGAYTSLSYTYAGIPTGRLVGTGAIDAPNPNTAGGNAGLGGSRPDIVCDPNLPRGERTFQRQFRTECVKPPSDANLLGNARGDELLGLGYANWDLSLFKNIPMGGNRRLQFRWEIYNLFNTDQWSGENTQATFDYLTGNQTNAAFGQLTGATRDARRMQLGLRFTF